jgi:hypothetical protein
MVHLHKETHFSSIETFAELNFIIKELKYQFSQFNALSIEWPWGELSASYGGVRTCFRGASMRVSTVSELACL